MFITDEAKEEFSDVLHGIPGQKFENPDSVVIALAPKLYTYEALNEAFRVLKFNPSAPLIAAHLGRYQMSTSGFLELGPGPFVRSLEHAAGVTAKVIGKPSSSFFVSACEHLCCLKGFEGKEQPLDLSDVVMVGDDAQDDVIGALKSGLGGAVLVRTGKYQSSDDEAVLAAGGLVMEDLKSFIEAFLENNNFLTKRK
eukprot:GDKJ01025819.1.p1 GENE.GDKJ01025819.1~~GDKJ01025819.1.p1  ORF type:complete len:197 (-),score=43.78 GDKJ01025819.1:271-861(-)